MRVGFLTPEYPRPGSLDGGLANYLKKVSAQLIERGHQAAVFVQSSSDRRYEDGGADIIEVKSAEQPRLPEPIRFRLERVLPCWIQLRTSKRLEKAVWDYHQSKPLDILQTSSYSAPGFTLRKNGKIPLVCRISSYSPMWRSGSGRRRTFAEYLTDWLEIRLVLDSDAAFVPSRLIAQVYERLEGYRPMVLETPFDAPSTPFDRSLYEEQFAGFPYLLFCGTLSRMKGVDLIADAIPRVLEAHPEIHFAFIGRDDGHPDGMRMMEFVHSKCKGHEASIHSLPAIPKSQLYPIMAGAIAVLIPSRIDNYPNVCLEAQSLSVPVIGSNGASLEEMIEDGITGFLIRNENALDLSAAMIRAIEMPDQERNRMKDQIRKRVEAIAAEDRVGKLIRLYDQVIGDFHKKHS